MSDTHSPASDSPNTAMPGIRSMEIPIPPALCVADDSVLMHDDLEILVSDAEAVCLTLGTLVALLRGAGGTAGIAELLEGVRLRAEQVLEEAQDVQRTVLAWAEA